MSEDNDALIARLRSVIDAAGLVVWEWNVVDDLFYRDGGEHYGPAPLDLPTFLAVVHEEDRPAVKRAVERSVKEGVPYDVVYRKAVDDEFRWFHATAEVIRDASGRTIRLVGATADITRRRELEERLRAVQRMEAVARFAGGLAHDFNNLLTTILASTDLLRSRFQGEDGDAIAELASINTAVERTITLARQLLTISRNEPTRPKLVDLNQIAMETGRLATLDRPIEFQCKLAPETLIVRADPARIHQLLLNLVGNARDAVHDGGTITIETSCVDLAEGNAFGVASGSYARIIVSDTGEGMTDTQCAHAFEPFFMKLGAEETTGLGLAMVHAIATKLGGNAMVESRLGEGTRFTILLPRHPRTAATPSEPVPPSSEVPGLCVLLVEDNAGVRSIAKQLLEMGGHTVIEACNGEEAIPLFEKNASNVGLVITDVAMPKMGGVELARRLKERAPSLRILFTSGYSDDVALHQGIEAGDISFLTKPYSGAALLEAVAEALAKE